MIPTTTIINKRLTQVINQDSTPGIELNGAEGSGVVQKRSSAIGSPSSPQLTNETEIREHFRICLKLYAENKISRKNVWKLKMIDCLARSQSLPNDSLQMAGTSLDVSAKIYGIRVDSIYNEGMKLASDLSRSNNQNTTEVSDNDQNVGDFNTEANRRGSKFNMVSGKKLIIAKNPETLLGDIQKKPSLLFQISIDPNASPMENLLTSKIPLNPGCYNYMLLSKEKAWLCYGKKDPIINYEKTYPFQVFNVGELEICAPFADFEIDEWNINGEHTKDIENAIVEDEVAYDSEGIPIPKLDDSAHSFDGEIEENNNEFNFKHQSDRIHVNQYSCSSLIKSKNSDITQIWAGPNHWKLKGGKKRKKLGKSITVKEKKRRPKPLLVDFHRDSPRFNPNEIYKVKQRQIDVSPTKCTFPLFKFIKSDVFKSLMLKRYFIVNANEEVEPPSRNFEETNNSQHYSNHELDENNNESVMGEEFETMERLQRNVFKDNLIEMPEMVSKTCIPFSTRVKKIDMKKLQQAIWKCLLDEDPGEIPNGKELTQRKKFSDVYKVVSEKITHKLKEELSFPLAFVAMLHLANRYNLYLAGQPDLADFTIEQGKFDL